MRVRDDFVHADLGDARRTRRLVAIAESLAVDPTASIPRATRSTAAQEAVYRFLQSDNVSSSAILKPHYDATVERMKACDLVIVAHDTTQFSFSTDRAGLGRTNGGGPGFHAHVSLAIDARSCTPLGVVGLHTYSRVGPKKPRKRSHYTPAHLRESARWREGIEDVEARTAGARNVVHVADSEADAYPLLVEQVFEERRFVVRLSHDRVVSFEGERASMCDALATLEGVFERDVPLSRRTAPKLPPSKRNRNMPRNARLARLSFTATKLSLRAPQTEWDEPRELSLNVVHVRELDAPEGEEPVDWKLATTEPIETADDIARIVDIYRARWTVEEYFKALKTGCDFESKQLESMTTLVNALAIYIPIAVDLLRLRNVARDEPTRPARDVVPAIVLRVLHQHPLTKLPDNATCAQAMLAIARFGGHIVNNGPPGWQVLGRGYETVRLIADGFALATGKVGGDPINH